MSEITILGPDGQRFVFPAGTDKEVMKAAMRRRYTGETRRMREMILTGQLPDERLASAQQYLSEDQVKQDIASGRVLREAERVTGPEDVTKERFYTAAQGRTLGAAPLLQGAMNAPIAALMYPFLTDDQKQGLSFGEFVDEMSGMGYQTAKGNIARAREKRPLESLGIEVLGGVAAGLTSYDRLGQKFLADRAGARGAAIGAGSGFQYGFLEGEGDVGEGVQGAAIGAPFGLGVSKTLEAAAEPLGRMFQRGGTPEPAPAPTPEPAPEPTPNRYFGRQSFDRPPRAPDPRVDAERATWAPTAPILTQAGDRVQAATDAANRAIQTKAPGDIARAKDLKKGLVQDLEATVAAREGMATPDDQRLTDALETLREDTSNPVLLGTQFSVAKQNLDQLMLNQGLREPGMGLPVRTTPPFRPSQTSEPAPASPAQPMTRYAEGETLVQIEPPHKSR